DAELKIVTAKGNPVWVRTIGKPVIEDGQCVRVYGAFQDISPRKKQEAIYKEARERFEKVFNHSSIGIVLVNTNGKIISANPATIKMFGFDESDTDYAINNLTYKDLIHPDDLKTAIEYRQRLIDGEITHYSLKSRYYKKNGELILCKVNVSYIEGTEYSVSMIISHIADITAQKAPEDQVLDHSLRFQSAFEYSPNGMALVGLAGKWLIVSTPLCNMLGSSKNALVTLTYQA